MKIRLLPSTFNSDGSASNRQHYSCILVNDTVAIDAGSLANASGTVGTSTIRDVVLTHAHLDHIAGLPLFIDDLFPVLTEPVRVHASREVIQILETHIFNWEVYPRFSELTNEFGKVIEYSEIEDGQEFLVRGLRLTPLAVNHRVPTTGFIVSDNESTFAVTGDTAEMDGFWERINSVDKLDLLLVECAFPDEFDELAAISHHLTPKKLGVELSKFKHSCPIRIINIKPSYHDAVVRQLAEMNFAQVEVLEIGKDYVI